MGQAGANTQGPDRTRGPRPLSPHMQVWRWHVTMAASILTRASGVALYAGVVIAAAWAVSLAAGPEAYGLFLLMIGSWLGKLVLFGLTLSIFYHLAAGIRHLVFDTGRGFTPKTADMSAIACIAFAVVATLAVWIAAFVTGAA